MRIIHLALGKANPNRMNGVNRFVHKLATTQVNLGYEVELWGITASLEHNYPKRNYSTQLFPKANNPFRLHPSLKQAINQLDQSTIVHIHGAFIPSLYACAILLHRQSIPYVHSSHGAFNPIALKKNRWAKMVYFNLFERYGLKNARIIHVLGQSIFNHLSHMGRFPQAVLIPMGVDLEELHPSTKNDASNFNFGFCGRIYTKVKGLDLLLKGFQLYRNKNGQGKLHLIGDGRDMEEVKQLIQELDITSSVILHGAKFGEEKWELFRQLNVFLHPSRNEGFPTAVVEALGMGIPCIVSQATNAGAYIADYEAGICLKENEASCIAAAMHDMEEKWLSGQLLQIRENATHLANTEFTWPHIAKQFIHHYSTAIPQLQEVPSSSL